MKIQVLGSLGSRFSREGKDSSIPQSWQPRRLGVSSRGSQSVTCLQFVLAEIKWNVEIALCVFSLFISSVQVEVELFVQ